MKPQAANMFHHTRGQAATRLEAAAFTLMEVLVALVIVAMIAASLSASLAIAFKARKSAMNQLTGVRQARVALDIIARDLENTLPPTGVLAGAFIATPQENGQGLDSLEFYNTSPLSTQASLAGAADIQRVRLMVLPESEVVVSEVDDDLKDPLAQGSRLEQGQTWAGDRYVLVRRVTRRLLAQVEPQPPYEVLARNVVSFTLRYYDGENWLDEWDSTTMENGLPSAVEVTLVFNPAEVDAEQRISMESQGASQAREYTMTRIVRPTCYGWTGAAQQEQAQSGTGLQGGASLGSGRGP